MSGFSASVGRWANKTNDRSDKLRRIITIKLFGAIILDTPVDTGRLRSSWQCSIGMPDRTASSSFDTSGAMALSKVNSVTGKSKGADVVILTNSMDYAARIEYDGWSHTKAPDGMVRRNITRFKMILGETLQEVRS